MSKESNFLDQEAKSLSKALAALNDVELDLVVGGGHSECESDDGRGTSGSSGSSSSSGSSRWWYSYSGGN